jgi:hypothetical protein
MSRIWRDKVFIVCLSIASLSSLGLVYTFIKKINFGISSSASPVAQTKVLHATSPSSRLSSVSLRHKSGFMNKIPVAKVRPKSGNNEWRVGVGEEFDSHDLNGVIVNSISGDVIHVSRGTYDFSFIHAFKKIQIIGEEGVIFEVKNNDSYIPNSDKLILERVLVKFVGLAATGYIFIRKNINLTLKQVKLEGINFSFDLDGSSKVEATESQFYGVSFRVDGSSTLDLNNCNLEKAENFISMSGFGSVKIDKTHFTRFSSSAFYNNSRHTSLKAYDIKVDNGHYAFFGDEIITSDISHSSFSKLDSMSPRSLKINCVMCELSEIQR